MVLWVELLTKQFNASQDACEWFLGHMSQEPWWPVQVLIQCPNQMVRQMFQRLVIHVIQRLRQAHSPLYLESNDAADGSSGSNIVEVEGASSSNPLNDDIEEIVVNSDAPIGEKSCVTKFVKSLIALMENGAKAHLRHLTEFFGLLYEFSRMGEEETKFLLHINVIKSVSDFYLGHKNQNNVSCQ
jgi:ubiquitin carboxyl-terminal hydrolase 34